MPDDKRSRLKEWLETGEARLQPLSLSQREIWEASPVPPADVSNHICTYMEIRSGISPKECLAGLQRVVDKQEVLRLSILPGKTGPLQLIRKTCAPVMEYCELPAGAPPEALDERMNRVFDTPFDLLRGPLYRVEIVRRGPDDLVLVFAVHHAIADGWTLGVFVTDIFASYLYGAMGALGGLPPVPLTYTDWAAGERAAWPQSKLEEHGRFWKTQLAGAPRLWKFPAGSGPRRLSRKVIFIPAELTNAVRALARSADATLFSTLLTAFQITLARWTGVTDIVVGTPVANRTKQSVRETMGYCSGNVPIRGQVSMDRTFEESIRETHRTAVDSFANAMPFAELVRAVGDAPAPDHNPIFDVRFALQNHPIPDIDVPGLSVHLHMRSTGTARFDLGCEVTEVGDRLEVAWLHRVDGFTLPDIEKLHASFIEVLSEASRAPQNTAAALTA
jgi:hypothetical protein